MPYQKTKDGSLVNEVTLGDGYPLSNDLQPLKVGGEASPIEMSTSLPDGSDNGKVKVRGDLEVTGGLNFKNDVEVDLSFDDLSLSGDLDVAGSVGIGTTSPDELLHVASETDPTLVLQCPTNNQTNSGTISFRESGTTDQMAIKYNGSTNNLIIDTSSVSNAFVLQRADGHIGIGTTSPTEPLEVWSANSQAYHYPIVARNPYNNNAPNIEYGVGIKLQLDDGSEGKWASIAYEADSAYGNSGDLQFYVDGATNSTPRMTLLHEGKLGIGTTSPTQKLDVQGSDHTAIQVKSTDGTKVAYVALNNTDANYHLRCDGGNGDKFIIRDNTNSANRLAIDTAGKVGIGTVSPTTTLDVEGTVSYKHTAFTTAGPTDNVDVSDTTVLEVDTSSNNVVIGGFTGGVQGQILYVVKTDTANFIQLEHNEGGGSQDIFLTSGSDDRVVGYGGWTLYCNGTSWFALSNPTGAADAG